MKRTASLLTLPLILLVTSCTTTNYIHRQSVTTINNKDSYPAKNPHTVAVYTNDKTPSATYRVIGTATVSKHNLLGMQRQPQTVEVMLKNLAASIGGDGLINVSDNSDTMQANVIAFEKILI